MTQDRTKPPPGWEDSWDGPFNGPPAVLELEIHTNAPRYPGCDRRAEAMFNCNTSKKRRAEAEVIAEAWRKHDDIVAFLTGQGPDPRRD